MLNITINLPSDFAHYKYAPLDDSYLNREFMDWMRANMTGAWNWGEEVNFTEDWDESGGFVCDAEQVLAFRFEKEADAVMFKLTWC